jgi:glycosyltransferase involved in cell wall biosynthesis
MSGHTSVIIPVRNGANYLRDAIESVSKQLEVSDEILVVWDQSVDATSAVLQELTDPRIRAIEGPGRGISAGRNLGLAFASGDLIAFLDHDDLWPPGRHSKLKQALVAHSEFDAAFGRIRIRIELCAAPTATWVVNLDGRHVPGPNLGTGLFRRCMLDRINGFDESLPFGEDVDYFLRLHEAGMKIVLCETDGLVYRRHATNCTNDLAAVQRSVLEVLQRRISRVRI